MRPRRWVGVCLLGGLVVIPLRVARTQSMPAPVRVGLVLSGGGAKGFAHIGVLRALEDIGVPVHVITGNSMGALLGSLYAIGYSPESLETLVLSTDWAVMSNDAVPRDRMRIERKAVEDRHLVTLPFRGSAPGLPANVVAGQQLFRHLARWMWPARFVRDFRSLPIAFAAVATDIETGDAVLLDRGYLVDAVRASMSLPGFFSPVEIDGRTLVDGLLARNLPAQDARRLGADVLICSDVSAPLRTREQLRTVLDVLNQVISFRGDEARREERAACDVLIEPEMADLTSLSFDRIDEIVVRGRRAADGRRSDLEDVAERTDRVAPRPTPPTDSTYLVSVTLPGVSTANRGRMLRALDLSTPRWVTATELDAAIERLYHTEAFRGVSYRLDPAGPDPRGQLLIRTEGPTPNTFAVGVRYESRYKASILLSASLRNLLAIGSVTDVDLRLGQQLALIGRHRRRVGPGQSIAVALSGSWVRLPFDRFETGRRVATADVELWSLSAFGGVGLGRAAVAGLELKAEHARPKDGGVSAVASNQTYHTIAGVVRADTRDRVGFPTRGVNLTGRYEWSTPAIGSAVDFTLRSGAGDLYVPVSSVITVSAHVGAAGVTGDDVPPHYLVYLGGPYRYHLLPSRQFRFVGLDTQERVGPYVQLVGARAQFEIVPDAIVAVEWNGGNASDRWRLDVGDYEHGFGLTGGLRLLGGTAEATLVWSTADRRPNLSVNAGFPF